MVGPYSRDILRFGEIATAPDLTNLHAYVYGMWLPLVIGAWFMVSPARLPIAGLTRVL
jgi:hypothetical protein